MRSPGRGDNDRGGEIFYATWKRKRGPVKRSETDFVWEGKNGGRISD